MPDASLTQSALVLAVSQQTNGHTDESDARAHARTHAHTRSPSLSPFLSLPPPTPPPPTLSLCASDESLTQVASRCARLELLNVSDTSQYGTTGNHTATFTATHCNTHNNTLQHAQSHTATCCCSRSHFSLQFREVHLWSLENLCRILVLYFFSECGVGSRSHYLLC